MKKRFVLIILTLILFLPALLYAEQMEVPEDPEARAHFLNGLDLFLGGLYDEAISEYRNAIKLKPAYAYAHNNLGEALYEKGEVGEAKKEWEETLKIDKMHILARRNLKKLEKEEAEKQKK